MRFHVSSLSDDFQCNCVGSVDLGNETTRNMVAVFVMSYGDSRRFRLRNGIIESFWGFEDDGIAGCIIRFLVTESVKAYSWK